jgi:hypothetical protein
MILKEHQDGVDVYLSPVMTLWPRKVGRDWMTVGEGGEVTWALVPNKERLSRSEPALLLVTCKRELPLSPRNWTVICGLFEQVSEKNVPFWSGAIGMMYMMVFRNVKKTAGDKMPSHLLYSSCRLPRRKLLAQSNY